MGPVQFEFRPYARRFQRPLQTHHGEWSVRQGVLLCLKAEDRVGWGEIAPIPAFGSESFEAALHCCQQVATAQRGQIDGQTIRRISPTLPACRFGFESAWEALTQQPAMPAEPPPVSTLLPTGTAALDSPLLFAAKPASTFKWKIGVAPFQQEVKWLEELLTLLPTAARLRLDANGGLTWQQAAVWLQICDGYGIEFLEQPLPPDQLNGMLKLSQRYRTPIALDESGTTVEQLQHCQQQGWRGLFVIKAPLAGSPVKLRQFCQMHQPQVVWSSVFETSVARRYIQDYLIGALPPTDRASGFGVDHWFRDSWERLSPQTIWQQLAL